MSFETATEGRLLLARRWEVEARWIMYGTIVAMVAGWLSGHIVLAFAVVLAAMPSAWLFNLRCPNCSWLVYRQFGTADHKHAQDQFLAPLRSKHLWKQPDACSKCGRPFRLTDTKAASNAQTH